MTYSSICCASNRGGCGHTFTPAREFQKACSRDCASRMIGQVTEELRLARRQYYIERQATLSDLVPKPKRKRARRRRK
jgi:hypothetical protein